MLTYIAAERQTFTGVITDDMCGKADAAQKVTVTGTLDAKSNTIQVEKISPAK